MTFRITDQKIGCQPIADIDTVQNHPLGTIVRAYSSTLGEGEFIYLKGVASTVVGSIVNYDDNFQTALDSTAVAGPSRPLAVAMAACVADRWGWYQISGLAVAAKANSVSFADGAGLGAGSGLAVAVATGSVIQGAVVRTVASAKSNVTTVAIAINRPHDPSDVS
jgi:hypothetical protein